MSFVSFLECAYCRQRYEARRVWNLCPSCERPLWVRYDLERVAEAFRPSLLEGRPRTLWRYRELLPVEEFDAPVSLEEAMTPLLSAPRLAEELGMRHLSIKDESRLPTGSFKARGMALAVTMAKALGLDRLAVPTAGNAGGALAAYAARAGMEAYVFMPQDTPVINQRECHLAGAKTFLVDGLIGDCGRLVRQGKATKEWFDVSTLKEPYRIEGKKTMGLELAEQLGWTLPDVILYPTGGGTGLIGMGKAFDELQAIGWLKSPKKPRMIACQSDGCAPIVRAFEKGERFAEKFDNAATVASGIRVPAAVGDFMILDRVRESGGIAVSSDEGAIPELMQLGMSREGISFCPEAAVCLGALSRLVQNGTIGPAEHVVLFNTGAAQKYPDVTVPKLPVINPEGPIDWTTI